MGDKPCGNPTHFSHQLQSTLLLIGDSQVNNDRIRDLMPCADSDEDTAVIEVLVALHLVAATKAGERLCRTPEGDQVAANIRDELAADR